MRNNIVSECPRILYVPEAMKTNEHFPAKKKKKTKCLKAEFSIPDYFDPFRFCSVSNPEGFGTKINGTNSTSPKFNVHQNLNEIGHQSSSDKPPVSK